MRRIIVVLAVVCAAALGAVGWAFASPGSTVSSSPELHLYAFSHRGPDSSCDGDACGVGEVEPMRFTLPGTGTYTAWVSVSFAYVTKGDGRFAFAPGVARGTGRISVGAVAPRYRVVAPTPYRTSTSESFLVSGLPAGRPLTLRFSFGIGERHDARTSISADNLTVELRASKDG